MRAANTEIEGPVCAYQGRNYSESAVQLGKYMERHSLRVRRPRDGLLNGVQLDGEEEVDARVHLRTRSTAQ